MFARGRTTTEETDIWVAQETLRAKDLERIRENDLRKRIRKELKEIRNSSNPCYKDLENYENLIFKYTKTHNRKIVKQKKKTTKYLERGIKGI